MSVITQVPGIATAPPPYPIYPLTLDRYHKMIQAGILDEEDRLEFLEGYLVPKMVRKPPHDGTIDLAHEAVEPLLPAGWRIRIQSAVTTDDSEPEPDLSVVRGSKRTYLTRHPRPKDIGLLIEVSEATLQQDRTDKGRIYVRARISCYWVVNLIDRQIEVYTEPTGPVRNPRYRRHRDHGVNSSVPLLLDGQDCGSIPVRELLP
jgi:Uma2 family endonuclease